MSENSKVKELAMITSSLKIDEAILKSRKIMEESKALTQKNNEKKLNFDEKSKQFFRFLTSSPYDARKGFDTSRSSDISETPKVANQHYRIEDMQTEIYNLNNKISVQATNLKVLESALVETRAEKYKLIEEINAVKQKHRQEIEHLTEVYEGKIRNIQPKIVPKELVTIESRVRDLEEKFKGQAGCNCELLQKINGIGKQKSIRRGSTLGDRSMSEANKSRDVISRDVVSRDVFSRDVISRDPISDERPMVGKYQKKDESFDKRSKKAQKKEIHEEVVIEKNKKRDESPEKRLKSAETLAKGLNSKGKSKKVLTKNFNQTSELLKPKRKKFEEKSKKSKK